MTTSENRQAPETPDEDLQSMEFLQSTVTSTEDAVTVALAGELDLSTAPLFARLLQDVVDTKPLRVNIDLAQLSFLDSSGIKCIVNDESHGRGVGCRIVVLHPSDMAVQVLTICGLDELLLTDAERDESSCGHARRDRIAVGHLQHRRARPHARPLAGHASILGGSLRHRRTRAQRRFAAAVLPRSLGPAAVRLVEQMQDGLERGRRASRARRTPLGRTAAFSQQRPAAGRATGFWSSSATRMPRSSPNTSCARRATTCSSCDYDRRRQSRSSANKTSISAIVDLMIGGGAGLALCEQLGERVRVLAVSALDQHDRALAAGAQAFIRKPFDSLTLVSATRDLIGTSAIVRAANRVSRG